MMNIEQRNRQGTELLEKVLGADAAQQMRKGWREISPDLEAYIMEFVAGEIWNREGLDKRTKSLVTIATVAALGRTRALELNIRMAEANGATRQEMMETLLHIAPYAGFPAAWEALATAKEILREDG
jgi:4-carboxymuconolactone decarboxylase